MGSFKLWPRSNMNDGQTILCNSSKTYRKNNKKRTKIRQMNFKQTRILEKMSIWKKPLKTRTHWNVNQRLMRVGKAAHIFHAIKFQSTRKNYKKEKFPIYLFDVFSTFLKKCLTCNINLCRATRNYVAWHEEKLTFKHHSSVN